MIKLGVLDIDGIKHILKQGESYLIGRKCNEHAHDIEINDESVDIKHCILDFSGHLAQLVDLKSKSGTYVGGKRVSSCRLTPISKSTSIKIGNVEVMLLMGTESDSGFLEGRMTPPSKDDSEVICNSPEAAGSSRLKHALKSSLTSTPNVPVATYSPNCPVPAMDINQSAMEFGSPAKKPRPSTDTNSSVKSTDSFCIPETQCPGINQSISHNPTPRPPLSAHKFIYGVSLHHSQKDEEDFFIPETQEVVINDGPRLSNYPRLAFGNDPIDEAAVDNDKIPSSQFRICTQDFNGSDENLSNHSDDILANVPCSLIIPTIRHSPVQIVEPLQPNDNKEADREVSNIRWSKPSPKPKSLSVTPDNILDLSNCSITPDIFDQQQGDQNERSASQCTTPDIFDIPEQPIECAPDSTNETTAKSLKDGLRPTQVFFVPPATIKPLSPPEKENIVPQKDTSMLAPTQKFVPLQPLKTPTQISVTTPVSIQSLLTPLRADITEDLPPTQVFQVGTALLEPVAQKPGFSSTLLESVTYLSENSFKAKCNKLLDSDDDEMDEVVAPEITKKIRQLSDEHPKPVEDTSSENAPLIPDAHPNEVKNNPDSIRSATTTTPIKTPDKITTPKNAAHGSKPQPVLSIDDFLFTPDFIGKEFTKDVQVQKEAEKNWNRLMSDKQGKHLFRDEDSSESTFTTETDTSQNSHTGLDTIQLDGERAGPKEIKVIVKRKVVPISKLSIGERLSRHRKSTISIDTKPVNIKKKDNPPVTKKDKTPKKSNKKDQAKCSSIESVGKKPQLRNTAIAKLRPANHVLNDSKCKPSDEKVTRKLTRNPSSDESKPISRQSVNKSSSSANTPIRSKHCVSFSSPSNNKNIEKKSSSSSDSAKIPRKLKRKASSVEQEEEKVEVQTMVQTTKVAVATEQVKHDEAGKSDRKANERKVKPQGKKNKTHRDECPAPRLTRLRSCLEAATYNKNEPLADTSTQTACAKNRDKIEVEHVKPHTNKDESSMSNLQQQLSPKIDLTNLEPISSRKAHVHDLITAVTNAVKRKLEEEAALSKRVRSSSSEDSSKMYQTAVRSSRKQPHKLKIAITMCDPRYQGILEKHSGTLWTYSKNPKDCDVLVVEKGNRTYKILVAIARGIPIVNIDWLIEVLRCKTTNVACDKFIFENLKFQERHHFVMKRSLQLAKTKSLFAGKGFMMTPNIRPIPTEMKDIISCAGGAVIENIKRSFPSSYPLFLVSNESDKPHWYQYRRMNPHIKIVTSEGVMASVMQQSDTPLYKSIIT